MNVKDLFENTMERLKLPTLKSNDGDWDKEYFWLNHNSHYGGYRIEYSREGETGLSDVHSNRMPAAEMKAYLRGMSAKGRMYDMVSEEFKPVIKITVQGGLVQEVKGLPMGYVYELDDRDLLEKDL